MFNNSISPPLSFACVPLSETTCWGGVQLRQMYYCHVQALLLYFNTLTQTGAVIQSPLSSSVALFGRHAQSEGNVNKRIYSHVPDRRLGLVSSCLHLKLCYHCCTEKFVSWAHSQSMALSHVRCDQSADTTDQCLLIRLPCDGSIWTMFPRLQSQMK